LTPYPIVVDLDGTLIHTDMLHESALKVFREAPLDLLRIPFWLSVGKARLKLELARRGQFNPEALPFNLELLAWLREQKQAGRELVLCTATHKSIADAIGEHLGIFDSVMATDDSTNLSGGSKAKALEERFGHKGFDYAGNHAVDMDVWRSARRAIVVNGAPGLAERAAGVTQVERQFPRRPIGWQAWLRVLRVHQWLKNLLLFVPILAAHQFADAGVMGKLGLAFVAFCLCASAVYVANDLLDLESDRMHPRKRLRPFASGDVPAWMGVTLAPVLLASSVALGLLVGGSFVYWLLFYFALTCAYSWGLKRVMLLDCITLALLYTLRIVAGAAAANNELSFWLLAFSVFLFLSLAFVKRYAELEVQLLSGNERVHGRGYYTSDAQLIQTFGIASGYASVMVLALYLNSDNVVTLYKTPEAVWGVVPIMLFWISWMWMQAHRGQMHDDPVVFAVKDKASLVAGFLFAVVLGVGTLGLPW